MNGDFKKNELMIILKTDYPKDINIMSSHHHNAALGIIPGDFNPISQKQ